MCFNGVHNKELRSARIASASKVAVGSTVRFLQLQRVKGSVTPVRINDAMPAPNCLLPSDHPAAAFSKHTVATPDVLAELRQQQRAELEELLTEGEDPATALWVERAIHELDTVAQGAEGTDPLVKAVSAPPPGAVVGSPSKASGPVNEGGEAEGSQGRDASRAGANIQYFHQCHDGRAIFLHPWSNKMLLHNRGLTGTFPEDLSVAVIAAETHTVSEELRKRHTCLKHLPMSSSITFCEVNLEGIVEPATMAHFQEDIKKRAKQRKSAEVRLAREQHRKSGEPALGGEFSESYIAEAAACGVQVRHAMEAPNIEEASLFPLLAAQAASSYSSPPLTPVVSFAALTTNGYAAGSNYPPGLGTGGSSPPRLGQWGGETTLPNSIILPGTGPIARAAPRIASFGGAADEDEVPPEFRPPTGGPSGLSDFLVTKDNSKEKKKGKKKKKNAADDFDFFFETNQ